MALIRSVASGWKVEDLPKSLFFNNLMTIAMESVMIHPASAWDCALNPSSTGLHLKDATNIPE